MDVDVAERLLADHRVLHHHHPRDPEEDDVEAGDENGCREVALQLRRLVGPAQRADRPEARREPGVEHVRIAVKRNERQIPRSGRRRFGVRGLGKGAQHAEGLVHLDDPHLPAGAAIGLRGRLGRLGVVGGADGPRLVEALAGELRIGAERGAVPDRNLVPPPELARNAPRLDALEPVEVDLAVALGHDPGLAGAHGLDRRADDLRGVDEPLVGQHRLDHHLGAVAEGLHDRLALHERNRRAVLARHGDRQPLRGDLRNHPLAGLEAVETAQIVGHEVERIDLRLGELGACGDLPGAGGAGRVVRAVGAHRAGRVHQPVHRDAAPLGDAVVVEVVGAGDLHRAGAELRIGILVDDDGDLPARLLRADGNLAQPAHDRRVAGVGRVDRDRPVAEHGLGARGGDGDVVALLLEHDIAVLVALDIGVGFAVGERILEVPHVAVDLDVLDLEIGDRGLEMRVPVHQPLAPVDQPLAVHVDEDPDDGVVEVALLARGRAGRAGHGEGVARPVARRAEPLELVDDGAAGGDLPLPDLAQEGLAAHLAARRLPLLGEHALDHHLRGDPGMVLPRLPQRVEAAHAVPADQDVLQRAVEGVPHVQAAGDVGRRHHDAEGVGARRVRAGREGAGLLPCGVDPPLGPGRVECLFHRHGSVPGSRGAAAAPP